MSFQEIITRVESSQEWKTWHAAHAGGFLAHGFMLLDAPNKDLWQIGYFCPTTDRMTTFMVEPQNITVGPEAEVMKDESGVLPLNLNEVQIDELTAMNHANKARAVTFPGEHVLKVFFILQTLRLGTVYNITFVTQSLRTLNFKIASTTGTVLAQSGESLVQMSPGKKS